MSNLEQENLDRMAGDHWSCNQNEELDEEELDEIARDQVDLDLEEDK